MVLTFIFLTVIFCATSKAAPAGFAGIAIGLSLFIIHLFGIMVSGASVNPARSLGPALLAGGTALGQVWLYILAPVIGALIAAYAYKYLLGAPSSTT